MKQPKRRRFSHRQMMALQMVLSALILFTKGGIQEICIVVGEMLFSDVHSTESVESKSLAE
ncbi:hypothetical protein N836_27870 [Leptolyngbya sp. Heron Island J]|uniref:hypothetical protein n=1 Tax=Leptolyngbya sp. Heron Island J TaxID=1385935 RepID=UPI0003B93FD5|nr:hypothetical protein [Leptolyngbya sp. Heron Island J]ESA32112.1 hypothetical protein N836_27870 [Leptolyngbya sp. Heron Island J]